MHFVQTIHEREYEKYIVSQLKRCRLYTIIIISFYSNWIAFACNITMRVYMNATEKSFCLPLLCMFSLECKLRIVKKVVAVF